MDKNFQKRKEYSIIDSSRIFLWALFLPQLVAFALVFIIVVARKSTDGLADSVWYVILASLLSQLCFAGVYYFFNKKRKIDMISASKLNVKLNKTNIIVCVLISMIAVFGLFNFISVFDIVFEKLGFPFYGSSLPLDSFGWFLVNVLLIGVLPAIFEELIFRGVIFNGLRKKGFWLACVVSSLFFAIIHLSIWQSIYPFIMGIILCLVAEKTGSTVYSMIVHFCNNFIVLLISYISNIRGSVPSAFDVNSISKAFMAVFVAVVSLITIWFLIKQFFKRNDEVKPMVESIEKYEKKQLIITFAFAIITWLIFTLA